jgi:subtilisin-like proprotein convertase family protein
LLRIFKKSFIFHAKLCTLLIWSALKQKKVSMQPNFTLKKGMFFSALMVLALSLMGSFFNNANGQTTITTTGTNYTGTNGLNGAAFATFAVQNTNTYDIVITGVSSYLAAGSSSTYSLWRSTSSLSGATGTIASPSWTSVATGSLSSASSAGIAPVLNSISVIVPAGATHRFALVANNGISYSGTGSTIPTPNTHSGGGVNLLVGNATVSGSNVGYTGTFPDAATAFNPRFFTGSITFVQSTACSGTPVPGNTIASVTSACAGTPFNLSLQNSSSATGLTYQWQSSTDGTTWTNITGANSATYSASLTAATYYRCQVTCSGNTGISTAVLVGLTPPSGCYCIPGNTSCAFDDEILNVTLNTLNNSSSGCTSTSGYTYYSSVAAPEVYVGAANPMSVRVGPGGTERVAVWIDYNKNGVFEDSEFTDFGSGNGVTITNNIVVPASALAGVTRMRVRTRFSTALTGTQACLGYTYGETEDYNVNLVPCVPVRYATQPASATVTCGGNATFTVSATGTLPAYKWQYRTSATAVWQDLPNGGPVSGATTATLTLTSVPATWNGYQVRALLRGGCAGDDPSSPANVTVNAPVATVTPTSAVICNGSSQTLALTNLVSVPATTTVSSGTISVTIPESASGATSATNTLSVSGIPAGSVITRIDVKLNVTHGWVGDVVANIKAPNGAVFNLAYVLSATGGAGATTGFTNTVISSAGTALLSSGSNPYTGTFRADAVSGTPPAGFPPYGPAGYIPTTNTWGGLTSTPNGNWTLALYDYYVDPDPGRLTNWTLEITYVAPNYAQGIWTSAPSTPNTLFLDAALTQAYDGSAQTTVYAKPAVNTVYSVSFTNPLNGCVSAVTNVPVTVGLPIAGLTAPATVATCVGSGFTVAATHTAVPSTNATPTYQWQVSADGGVNWSNISGATGTTLSVASTTQSMNGYRYRIQVTSGGCTVASSTPTVLTVNALPTITLSTAATTLTPGKTTTVTGASSPAAATWAWTLNGASLAGTTNSQVANIDGLGTYQATVRDINGCVNSSNKLTLTAEASDKLWIYPNPTAGAFQIRYYHAGDANEKRIISVYNTAGQLVATKSFDLSYTSAPYLRMDVDLSGAARGTYVVKVAHEYSGKIISGLVLVQ